MRGIVGRVCHGRERGPLEPYSVIAPALRLVAWAALFVACVAGLATVVAIWLIEEGAALLAGRVAVVGLPFGLALLWVAGGMRPDPLTLTAWDRAERP